MTTQREKSRSESWLAPKTKVGRFCMAREPIRSLFAAIRMCAIAKLR